MVFDGILYHICDIVILKLLWSSDEDLNNAKRYTSNDDFRIYRYNYFELTKKIIYLPGVWDRPDMKFPIVLSLKVDNIALYLRNYKEAYIYVNKTEPIIIDLDKISDFKMEEVG